MTLYSEEKGQPVIGLRFHVFRHKERAGLYFNIGTYDTKLSTGHSLRYLNILYFNIRTEMGEETIGEGQHIKSRAADALAGLLLYLDGIYNAPCTREASVLFIST
jgi:hypothetical protein